MKQVIYVTTMDEAIRTAHEITNFNDTNVIIAENEYSSDETVKAVRIYVKG